MNLIILRWNWTKWEKHLDWMAMKGINLVILKIILIYNIVIINYFNSKKPLAFVG